jgi:hypothetical protein
MENNPNNTGQQTIQIQVPTLQRAIMPLSFAVVIILFFFTFCEFKCTATGRTLESVKGISFVAGKELRENDLITGRERPAGKIPPNFWAILSLGSAVIGLGAYLIREKREALIGIIAGIAGFVSLFILQYDIKSKITKDSEGQVNAVFQFPFWLALIAFVIAVVIGFLRRRQFPGLPAGSTSKESTDLIQNTITSVTSTADQTSNFDIGKWIAKNKYPVSSVAGILILALAAYFLFFKHDPIEDGKKAAVSFCNCGKKEKEKYKGIYKNYLADFDSYKFSGRDEANQRLSSLIQMVNDETQKCYSSNRDLVEKLKSRYVGMKEDTKKFQSAYTERATLCNNDNTEVINYRQQALNKITAYVGPVEKEQQRQDSIAAENAQLELQTRLEYAQKNQPTIERMKQDLLGRTISLPPNDLGWTSVLYDDNVKYLGFKTSGNSFQQEMQIFSCNADILSTWSDEGNQFSFIGVITYTWDLPARTWNFQDFSVQQFKKIK